MSDEWFHVGDVVRHKASGLVGKVARFASDGTTDFFDEKGTGPYKQADFERLAGPIRKEARTRMTVHELRKKLAHLPGDLLIVLEVDRSFVEDADNDLVQAELAKADVECRCDDEDILYLWGSQEGE